MDQLTQLAAAAQSTPRRIRPVPTYDGIVGGARLLRVFGWAYLAAGLLFIVAGGWIAGRLLDHPLSSGVANFECWAGAVAVFVLAGWNFCVWVLFRLASDLASAARDVAINSFYR